MATKYCNISFMESSFLEGLSRLLDIGSNFNIYIDGLLSPREEDYYEMKNDWSLTAHDLNSAIKEYEKEIKFEKKQNY